MNSKIFGQHNSITYTEHLKGVKVKITLIIGLPGSGKSTYARNKFPGSIIIDDPKNINELPDTTEDFVIIDPWLCDVSVRDKCVEYLIQKYNCDIVQIFFDDNITQCQCNIIVRGDRGDKRDVGVTFNILSKRYTIPDNIVPEPVWRG